MKAGLFSFSVTAFPQANSCTAFCSCNMTLTLFHPRKLNLLFTMPLHHLIVGCMHYVRQCFGTAGRTDPCCKSINSDGATSRDECVYNFSVTLIRAFHIHEPVCKESCVIKIIHNAARYSSKDKEGNFFFKGTNRSPAVVRKAWSSACVQRKI